MIKTVLIDIDNTLLDFDKCAKQSLILTAKELNMPYFDEMFNTFITVNDALWLKIEDGALTKDELHRIRFNIIFDKLNIKADGVAFEKVFRKYLHVTHEPVDGAEELLKYLSEKYSVYAVSNAANREQNTRLKGAGLSKYMKGCFVSEVLGAEKPTKEFFDACFNLIGNAKIKETVIIGDSLTADIKGGKDYGLTTIWFNYKNKSSTLPDYSVNSLLEIKEIL